MKKKKRGLISFITVLIVIIGIIIAIGKCIYNMKERLNAQIQASLVSTAEQNTQAMEREVSEIHTLLNEIAQTMQRNELETMEAKVEFLQPYAEIYGFKRMGIFDASGTAYSTDGYKNQVRDTSSFEAGMAGKWYISDRIEDSLGEPEKINIFSVPVYNKENTEVECVLFATYSADQFDKVLTQNIFYNEEFCFILKVNGTIVAGKEILSSENIASFPNVSEKEIREIIDAVKADMQAGNARFRQVNLGVEYVTYYMPIEITGVEDTWYLFTVIPASTLANQFDSIWYDVERMVSFILVGLAIIFILQFILTGRQNQMLEKLAYEDALTGGDNYVAFKEKLEETKTAGGYVVSLDIGDFRMVNNICGEKTGDQLLIYLWEALQHVVKKGDLGAHINGDHYVLYLETGDKNEIIDRIKKVTEEFLKAIDALNVPHVIPYFGICALDNFEQLEKVYSRASQAKNRIKSRRDENYAFYDDKVFQQTVENKRLEDGFEHAIQNEEFEVWYQPKYDAVNNSCIVGAEALVRWRKDGELIPPFRFIPLFEKNGMIAALDEYVFRRVCKMQKKWKEEGKAVVPVSVNISRASLFFNDIAERYENILNEYQLEPKYILLEITESAMLENDDVTGLIDKFRDTGFRLLLDDFGNGYSSLSSLNTMKFDILKLDKSLIDYIGDGNGEELLRHTVELAKYLGLNITAEGVETIEQVVFLQAVKCDDIQGYYFSKPLPEPEYEALLIA